MQKFGKENKRQFKIYKFYHQSGRSLHNLNMSYFIYMPSEFGTTSEQIQAYTQLVPDALIKPYQFYIQPTIQNSQYSLPDNQNLVSQPEILHQVASSAPQPQASLENTRQKRRRERNVLKQIESAKKNSESNIINHFFSFFNAREKSQKIVENCINSLQKDESQKEKLLHLFYNTIHIMNTRRGRKYVNKSIFKTFFNPEKLASSISQIKDRIEKINGVTVMELCQVFRKCCYSFFRTYSLDSILTSRRISCVAKEQHFRKRRKILRGLYKN